MPVNITRCSNNYGPYQFLEKLIPLDVYNRQGHGCWKSWLPTATKILCG